jgi:hypothetical protein
MQLFMQVAAAQVCAILLAACLLAGASAQPFLPGHNLLPTGAVPRFT